MAPDLEKIMMPMIAMLMSNRMMTIERKGKKMEMKGLKDGSTGTERKFSSTTQIKPTRMETGLS